MSAETQEAVPGYTIEQSFEAVQRVRELASRFELALVRRSTEAGVASGDPKMTKTHVDSAVEEAARDVIVDTDYQT